MTATTATPAGPPGAAPARPAAVRAGSAAARWERPALAVLLLATAALYLWDLSSSGYANSFYSAAVQAGSESWKAFFFGSSDAANSITVDKPPAALWPMALSVRLFGLGSWQILAPEALMGVGTAAVLHASVRRQFGAVAGLIAGAVFALTPVAALMFRFNNPDALLTLLLTVAVYCVLRALEGAHTRWLVAAGAAVGLAFLTKTLQAFVVLPPLAVLYAVCAPTRLRRRLGQLALAGLALVVSGGWWVAVVELWPASSRPYIGGSQDNSFLELTFGYNGLGRINGNETGSVGGRGAGGAGGAGGGGMWGETGIDRLFSDGVGGQVAWLLPAALVLLVAGLVLTWRAGRATDRLESMARAAFLAWGGCLLITALVFSFMQGIFHEYYTVALAPYIAALVGMGARVLWEERGALPARAALAGTLLLTAVWSYVLLGRATDYLPWLRWTVLVGGVLAAAGLLLRRTAPAAAGLGLALALAGPLAYCLTTVSSGHTGSIPTAGPAVAGGRGFPGGPGGGGRTGADAGRHGAFPGGAFPGGPGPGQAPGGTGGLPNPGQGGNQGFPPGMPGTGTGTGERAWGGGPGGGMGGLLGGTRVSAAAEAALTEDAAKYTWVAAAIGSQNAAGYQLATEKPVMAVGGFNGSDPSPTLARFKEYVAQGKIHYFIASGGLVGESRDGGTGQTGRAGQGGQANQPGQAGQGGQANQPGQAGQGGPNQGGGAGGPGGGTSSAISSWVTANFTQVTIEGATFYDLTAPKA
ncbi:glycosyltransferase family 39 protein [Streptomyces sp. NRRL S-87]|uniref:ArnT family glycosyltransferase n=1 Tax=Streptomyces sp. NRRL S-87 TaxID=1463920 RepID=UPI0004BF1DF3|nr:glycosyltransferase family 39 protein [Streptomyces sp. NRRL S-87]